MNILNFYKKYLTNFKTNIISLVIISILSLLINMSSTYFTGRYIDLLTTNISVNNIYKYTLLVLCIGILNILLTNVSTYFHANVQSNIVFKLNFSLLQHVKKLPLSYFKNIDIVYLNQRINADSNVIINFILSILVSIIIQVISFLFIIIFLLNQNFVITIVSLLSIPLYIILYIKFRSKLYEVSYEAKEEQGIFFSHMYDQLANIKFTKINSLLDKLDTNLKNNFPIFLRSILRRIKYNCFFSSIKSMIENSFNIFLFLYGGIQIFNNNMTIGSFLIIKSYYSLLLNTISNFIELIKQYPDTLVSHNRICDIFNIEQEHNGEKVIEIIDSIQLERVSFSYNQQYILNDFSYTFKKNNVYLINGDNGTGKSTLIDVMLGLHIDNYEGNIYYNHINIKDLNLYDLRKKLISVLEQEPLLTDFNIHENLSRETNDSNTKNDSYSQEVQYWIDKLNINIISKQILDKDIADVLVSGGEKQKVALARTFIKDADVIIMDEPTSALDKYSVDIIKQIVEEVKFNKIIIIISHDIKLKSIADYIIEM